MKIVNFDCPEQFLKQFDEYIRKRGWGSRAEALREAMRQMMKES